MKKSLIVILLFLPLVSGLLEDFEDDEVAPPTGDYDYDSIGTSDPTISTEEANSGTNSLKFSGVGTKNVAFEGVDCSSGPVRAYFYSENSGSGEIIIALGTDHHQDGVTGGDGMALRFISSWKYFYKLNGGIAETGPAVGSVPNLNWNWVEFRCYDDDVTKITVEVSTGAIYNFTNAGYDTGEWDSLSVYTSGRIIWVDDISFSRSIPSEVYTFPRNPIDLWVDTNNNPNAYVREVGTGTFADGTGLIYKLGKDLDLKTSLDACTDDANFVNPNGLLGFGYSNANAQLVIPCNHKTQDSYTLGIFDGRAAGIMQEYSRELVTLSPDQCETQGNSQFICERFSIPSAEVIGPVQSTDSTFVLLVDRISDTLQEVGWTDDGPLTINTFDMGGALESASVDFKCGWYAAIGDSLWIRELGTHESNAPQINTPTVTGTAVGINFHDCVGPAPIVPAAQTANQVWVSNGTHINTYSYNFNTNLLSTGTSIEQAGVLGFRFTWDSQYVVAWTVSDVFVYDATTKTEDFTIGGHGDIIAAQLDASNSRLFVLDQQDDNLTRYILPDEATLSLGEIDSDGDGWTNTEEQSAGTDPYDADSTPTDSDGDGIADEWEIVNFGNLTAANNSTDADGDGFTDLQEFQFNTDPNDALDFPEGSPSFGTDEEHSDQAGHGTGSGGGGADTGGDVGGGSGSSADGGRLGEPVFPAVDIAQTGEALGLGESETAWLLGLLIVAGLTIAFGLIPMKFGDGSFSAGLAMAGTATGWVVATAFSLFPVWPLIVLVVLATAIVVFKYART